MAVESTEARSLVAFPIRPAEITTQPPPAVLSAAAGDTLPIDITLSNTGDQSGAYRVSLELGGGTVFSASTAGVIPARGVATVRFDTPLPVELPTGALTGEYSVALQTAPDSFTTARVGVIAIDVSPFPLAITARADRTTADAGEVVSLTLDVETSAGAAELPLIAAARYGAREESQAFTLDPSGASVTFALPVDSPGRDLAYGVYWPSGRAAYLGQKTILPGSGDVLIRSAQEEWAPGQPLQLEVTLNEPGTVEIVGFGQTRSVAASGVVTLEVPPNQPYGEYPLIWTYSRSGADPGVTNGSLPVRIRGPLVRITELGSSSHRPAPGEIVTVTGTIVSDTTLEATLKLWVEAPDKSARLVSAVPVDLSPNEPVEVAIPVTIQTPRPGTHRLVAGVVLPDGTLVSDAGTSFDVGAAQLLGVEVLEAEGEAALTAWATLQGSGLATLSTTLDGNEISTTSVALSGVQRAAVPLPDVAPGEHSLTATLLADGLASTATTPFRTYHVNHPPDLTSVRAVPAALWPPNGKLMDVSLAGIDDPDGDQVEIEITGIWQDEPLGKKGRSAQPDASRSPLRLRARRDGNGDGRTYHIYFLATDEHGAESVGEATVCVAHDLGQGSCVDGGPLFDSTGGSVGSPVVGVDPEGGRTH